MQLHHVRAAYAAVNVAGYVNDTLLGPKALCDGLVSWRVRDLPPGPEPLASRIVGAFDDTARNALRHSQRMMAIGLNHRRNPPFLPGPLLLVAGGVVGLPVATLFYPLADALLGRGHTPERAYHDSIAPPDTGSFSERYNTWSHHGILGHVLEAVPVRRAQRLEQQGRNKAACACMLAAIVGRLVLQPARLLVCALALTLELLVVVPIQAALTSVEVFLRTLMGAVRLFGQSIGVDIDALEVHYPVSVLPDDDTRVDDGSPGVNQRIRMRVSGLTLRLRALFQNDDAAPKDVMGVVDSAADDLRRYCARLPDDEALRYGLALLRDSVALLWWDDPRYVFAPPELAPSAQTTAPKAA